jgi:kinetochore protein Mis13/DSN1
MRLRALLVRWFSVDNSSCVLNCTPTVQPHSSVSDFTLYKHIDPEAPESQRARQLLVWSAHRASSAPQSTSIHSNQQGKDPPPKLNSEGAKILRQVQERIIKMLVDKLVDTSVFGDESSAISSTQVRANEQNVMNRGREEKFLARIERYVHVVD